MDRKLLPFPFRFVGGGLVGLAGLTIYWWAYAIIFMRSADDSIRLGASARGTIEAISFTNAHTAIFLSWPALFVGLLLVYAAFQMGDQYGRSADAYFRGILSPVFTISVVLAGFVFFVCGGLMVLFLPFALAGGGAGELFAGPMGILTLISGLLLGIMKLDDR